MRAIQQFEEAGKITGIYEYNDLPCVSWKHFWRIASPGADCLDEKPLSETRDLFCYGRTLDEACAGVLKRYAERSREVSEQLELMPSEPIAA